MAAYLSARQAADLCGVSERTIRNWITSGKLSAEKSAGTFRIDREHLEALAASAARTSAGAERNGADPADHPQTPSADSSAAGPAMLELVHLVDRLQREVVARTEAATLWQARAEMLASQLERAQLALDAPKEETPHQRPLGAPTDAFPVEPPQSTSASRNGRPWWAVWRRATS